MLHRNGMAGGNKMFFLAMLVETWFSPMLHRNGMAGGNKKMLFLAMLVETWTVTFSPIHNS